MQGITIDTTPQDEPEPIPGLGISAGLPSAQNPAPDQPDEPDAPGAPDPDDQLAIVPNDSQTVVPVAVRAQFSSPVRLTPDQEKQFVRDCGMRVVELQREMGLTVTNDVIDGSWMWLRWCNDQYYQGDLSWRIAFGGIFPKCNLTLGSGLRHVRYNSARVQDDLLGTTPFMAALSAKSGKEEMAKQVENYVQGKIDDSNVRAALREAQKVALYINECVVKTGYISDTTPFVGEATVLVDSQTGEPIKTPDKQLYVFEHDQMTPHPQVQDTMMLESDPTFICTAGPKSPDGDDTLIIPAAGDIPDRIGVYQHFDALPQVLVHEEGVYAAGLDYRSFLCPLKVRTIHEADTVAHLYLESPARLQKIYGGIDVSQQYFAYWNAPGQDKPKYAQGEQNMPTTAIYQQIVVAEIYRRCDPDQTGEDKEMLMVMDWTNQKPIYYNYLANHMGKRPFEPIPGVEKLPNRWYGRGIYGMLQSHLFYEDVEISRAFFKNSMDATIQFARQNACSAWKNGLPPQIGTGETYWLNDSFDMDGKGLKPIWRENMQENFKPDLEIMNTMRQSADSLVGAISTASASQSGFDPSKTATGDQLVQQASDIIARATEQDQSEAIEKILKNLVDIILEHADPKILAVDESTQLVATINRNEARSLDKDVRLLLTRARSSQLLSTSGQLVQLGKDYWQLKAQNPIAAKALRPGYVMQGKALESDDTDTMFPDITPDEIQQWQQAQQNQQGKPPSESISVKLPDLVGNERDQALAKMGIQADHAALQQQVQQAAAANAQSIAAPNSPAIHALPKP